MARKPDRRDRRPSDDHHAAGPRYRRHHIIIVLFIARRQGATVRCDDVMQCDIGSADRQPIGRVVRGCFDFRLPDQDCGRQDSPENLTLLEHQPPERIPVASVIVGGVVGEPRLGALREMPPCLRHLKEQRPVAVMGGHLREPQASQGVAPIPFRRSHFRAPSTLISSSSAHPPPQTHRRRYGSAAGLITFAHLAARPRNVGSMPVLFPARNPVGLFICR